MEVELRPLSGISTQQRLGDCLGRFCTCRHYFWSLDRWETVICIGYFTQTTPLALKLAGHMVPSVTIKHIAQRQAASGVQEALFISHSPAIPGLLSRQQQRGRRTPHSREAPDPAPAPTLPQHPIYIEICRQNLSQCTSQHLRLPENSLWCR